ncbi:MAG: membrane integrity-associated transporter subunit PqiC [Nitrospirae bacterium]|uniref:ABC-type transport auxiliary lipoprotein family protein n=1 Tax=Candidatus Magnetobacterium casense TaxID=1455061 RepID=UPI00058F3CC7|nr:ABC-type transport auxiliary lipoprotein family protein [Candidatus Magnetobacterium casensis]MBF0338602.1 membrane integrity-associated transporter subunit PqiC [Nitrospirota bacterium]
MIRLVMIMALLLFVGACNMPETKIYSLYVPSDTPTTDTGKVDEPKRKIAMPLAIIVDSPRYLTQPYIAYRNSPYELTIARYTKWDSAPVKIIGGELKTALSKRTLFSDVRVTNTIPANSHILKVNLRKFERYDAPLASYAELILDAELISPQGENLYRMTFSKRVKLNDGSFKSLAEGISMAVYEAIEQLCKDIGKGGG